MRTVHLLAVALLVAAAACGSGGSSYSTSPNPNPSPSPSGRTTSASMSGTAFHPAVDTVAAGASVTWTNHDGFNHTVTSAPGSGDSFASGAVPGGTTFSHTFSTPGTYTYYCTIHGTPTTGMRGVIVVQ